MILNRIFTPDIEVAVPRYLLLFGLPRRGGARGRQRNEAEIINIAHTALVKIAFRIGPK